MTIRTQDGYKIPTEIAEHVSLISGLEEFPVVRKGRKSGGENEEGRTEGRTEGRKEGREGRKEGSKDTRRWRNKKVLNSDNEGHALEADSYLYTNCTCPNSSHSVSS